MSHGDGYGYGFGWGSGLLCMEACLFVYRGVESTILVTVSFSQLVRMNSMGAALLKSASSMQGARLRRAAGKQGVSS